MIYDFLNIFTENSDNSDGYYRRALRAAVKRHIKKYNKEDNNLLKDETVKNVFVKCNSNTVDDVLAKVTILNFFYNTQLNSYPIIANDIEHDSSNGKKHHIDVISMAYHIASCSEFDKWIKDGDISAVEFIRDGNSTYRKQYHMKEYSFATKYCSFCACAIEQHDFYPIIDSFSGDVLYYLNHYLCEKGFPFHTPRITRDDLADYSKYCEIYQDFKKYLLLPDDVILLSNKAIDKFLWHYGKYPEDKCSK